MTKIKIKIEITKENKLKITIIDQDKESIILDTIPSITFNTNTIEVCKDTEINEKTIHFMKNWIDNPDDYSTYTVHFQKKEYQLLPEVMFSIIVNEFKKRIG